jgi:phosphoadenosine phosphosulfate reductase
MSTKVSTVLDWLRQAEACSPAVFSTSFGAEDMVLLDLIRQHSLNISIFTLDTGRLPEETYRLMQQVEERYGNCFVTYFPQADSVQILVHQNGINGFYNSIANRKACCAVRKLEPLQRALAGKKAWVTGLRAEQSVTRSGVIASEQDQQYELRKFNPLHDWTEKEVWDYLHTHAVPYNALHDKFYPSIGCAPCTRAIAVGEDIRAGRWWWEQADQKECGLHAQSSTVRWNATAQ